MERCGNCPFENGCTAEMSEICESLENAEVKELELDKGLEIREWRREI
jgi:hypothetical protein